MKIVLDSNILFSALLRESTTRRVLLLIEDELFLPYAVFEELEEHKEELLKKSGLYEKEFNELLSMLLGRVKIVPFTELESKKKEAILIVESIDPDDAMFIAACLSLNAVLWSEDKALKCQRKIRVINTKELLLKTGLI